MRVPRLPRRWRTTLLVVCCTLAGACVELPGLYKIDINQGNFVRAEQVRGLREGMTREQVRFILGEPLLKSLLHPDQWDYLYYIRPGSGEEPVRRHLRVIFADDLLLRYEVDFSLEDAEDPELPDPSPPDPVAPELETPPGFSFAP